MPNGKGDTEGESELHVSDTIPCSPKSSLGDP